MQNYQINDKCFEWTLEWFLLSHRLWCYSTLMRDAPTKPNESQPNSKNLPTNYSQFDIFPPDKIMAKVCMTHTHTLAEYSRRGVSGKVDSSPENWNWLRTAGTKFFIFVSNVVGAGRYSHVCLSLHWAQQTANLCAEKNSIRWNSCWVCWVSAHKQTCQKN